MDNWEWVQQWLKARLQHHLQIFRGNSCFTRSGYIQGVRVTLDKVKTITVRASVFSGGSTEFVQSPTKPSIIKLAGNRRLPLLHAHLHLPLPPPFTLAPCQLPSASPL